MFRPVEHQADIALEVTATSREGLFRGALEGLIYFLTGMTSPGEGEALRELTLTSSGFDDEERLVGLLSELLYAAQVFNWGPRCVKKVDFDGDGSVGSVILAVPQGGGANLAREIKAATYHKLKIIHNGVWRVNIVFDV